MKPVRSESLRAGLPVNALTGVLVLSSAEDLDFVLRGVLALPWQRTYCSTNHHAGWFGQGWSCALEVAIAPVLNSEGSYVEGLDFIGVTGRRVRFKALAPGEQDLSVADQMQLSRGEDGTYRLGTSDGLSYAFEPGGLGRLRLARVLDRHGNALTLRYQLGEEGDGQLIVDNGAGRRLVLHYRAGRVLQIDAAGASTVTAPLVRYAYNTLGDLTEVQSGAGENRRRFRYDARRMLTWQSHADTYECWTEYADQGTATKAVTHHDNVGRRWRLDYQDAVTAVTDVDGRVFTYHLDARQRWIGLTDPDGGFTARGLDAHGRVRMLADPAGHISQTSFDEMGNPVEVRDASGAVTQIAWHAELALPLAITDALGHVTRYEYDELGNLLAETSADGVRTAYEYNKMGLVTAVVDGRGGRSILEYDAQAQLIAHTDCSGRTTRLSYDGDGHLACLEDALGGQTTYLYDAAGRLVRQTLADGSFECYEWDVAGQLCAVVNELGKRTRYRYAADGLLAAREDASGQRISYDYDSARRLRALVNENGAACRFAYDLQDQVVEEVRFDGTRTLFDYDAAGYLIRTLEAPGANDAIATTYQRDPLGRLLSRITGDTQLGFAYDALGNIVQARSAPDDTLVKLRYDHAQRVIEEAATVAGVTRVISHAYDELGHRIQTVLPDGRVLGYLYYGNGHLHQVNLDGVPLTDVERDALHRELSRTQGKLVTTREYDPVGRTTAQLTRAAPGVAAGEGLAIADSRFRYDKAGRLIWAQGPDQTRLWAYDSLDRLTRYNDERFAFDPAHNLVDVGPDGQPASSGRVEGNRVLIYQDMRYQYDAHGRVIQKRVGAHTLTRFKWDGEHRLRSADISDAKGTRQAQYVYDAFGRRMAKTVDGVETVFVWDGDRLLQNLCGGQEHTFVHEPLSHVPMLQLVRRPGDSGGLAHVHHYHCDPVGLPRSMTDEDGRAVWQGTYGAWGRLRGDQCASTRGGGADASTFQPLRWQGQYADEETGWHYNRYRYFDPDIGRFTTPDPLGLEGGVNPYVYAPNPMGWIDPLGLVRTPAQKAADKALVQGKESGAACQLEINGVVLTDVSGKPGKLHPKLRKILSRVPLDQRPAWHGSCAEIGCLNQAFKRGLDPTGAKSTAVNIGAKHEGQKHGAPKKACPSCKHVLEELSITDGSA